MADEYLNFIVSVPTVEDELFQKLALLLFPETIETKEDIIALIAGIKKYANRFSEEDMELYYHCHDFEFQEFDGIRPIDCILNETDVMLELDVYWAEKGEGRLPCSQYWKAAEELEIECIIVEEDLQLPDGITSICNSMQAIRKIRMDG